MMCAVTGTTKMSFATEAVHLCSRLAAHTALEQRNVLAHAIRYFHGEHHIGRPMNIWQWKHGFGVGLIFIFCDKRRQARAQSLLRREPTVPGMVEI